MGRELRDVKKAEVGELSWHGGELFCYLWEV